MRFKRAARLHRTAHKPSSWLLSGFSHTLSSQMTSPSSPACRHCSSCWVARCQRNCAVLATWYIRSEKRAFEKRSPKEKRGVNDKRERAFLLEEGRCVAVRECSRPYLGGTRD